MGFPEFVLLLTEILVPFAALSAQNFEVTPFVGGQINGGLIISTVRFQRIDLPNGLGYGLTSGYLFRDYYGFEFTWNRNNADAAAEPVGGGPKQPIFRLRTDQYFGQMVLHFTSREDKLRPFAFFGVGATELSPHTRDVKGAIRFNWDLGAGAKYELAKHLGLRVQAKYGPTYIATHSGYWCNPSWGGCLNVGNKQYLNEFDANAGITLRF